MSIQTIAYILLGIGAFIFVALVGKRAGWFELVSGTNKLLREQNQELRNANDLLKQQIEELKNQNVVEVKEWVEKFHNAKNEIAELRGKIEATINLPLIHIDGTLKKLAEDSQANLRYNKINSETNQKVLAYLMDYDGNLKK